MFLVLLNIQNIESDLFFFTQFTFNKQLVAGSTVQ